MLHSVGRLCLVIVGSLVAAGCGGGGNAAKNVDVYKVSGTVMFLGKPLTQAVVTFSPIGRQPVAFGTTNDQGEFTLTTYTTGDGAAAGNYAVMVKKAAPSGPTASTSTDPGHSADGSAMRAGASHDAASTPPAAVNLIPADYSDSAKTPLKATVDPKTENKFTFEIKE